MSADRSESPGALWPEGAPADRRVEVLAERVGRLVDAPVSPVVQGELGRLLSRARYAGDVLNLSIQDPVGRFRIVVADRMDLSPPRLAEAACSVMDMRRRFPWAAVKLAAFDDASALCGDPVSGVVMESKVLEIHVDVGLVCVGGADVNCDDPEHGLEGRRTDGSRRAVSALAQVVTHECWHVVEAVFEASRYRDSIEFRRALGRLLGVATFEHVYGAGSGTSSAQRVAAENRLREAVGAYATKSRAEGTAELFTAWWFGERSHPLVAEFGALVEHYLPVTV